MNELVVAELDGFLNITASFGVLLVNVSYVTTASVARAVPRLKFGAVFGVDTMILTVCSSQRAGEPLSVTRITAVFVLKPAGGAQVNVPGGGTSVAPAGAVARAKVKR